MPGERGHASQSLPARPGPGRPRTAARRLDVHRRPGESSGACGSSSSGPPSVRQLGRRAARCATLRLVAEAFDRAGLPRPALAFDAGHLPPRGTWLCKPRRSAGGAAHRGLGQPLSRSAKLLLAGVDRRHAALGRVPGGRRPGDRIGDHPTVGRPRLDRCGGLSILRVDRPGGTTWYRDRGVCVDRRRAGAFVRAGGIVWRRCDRQRRRGLAGRSESALHRVGRGVGEGPESVGDPLARRGLSKRQAARASTRNRRPSVRKGGSVCHIAGCSRRLGFRAA